MLHNGQQFEVSVKTSRKDEHMENALLRSQKPTSFSFWFIRQPLILPLYLYKELQHIEY